MTINNLPGQELISLMSKLMEKSGASSIDDLGKMLPKKQGGTDFLSSLSVASPYIGAADFLLSVGLQRNLGTEGFTGIASTFLPGLTSAFSTKIKSPSTPFKPISSYSNTFKDASKLNDTAGKYYLP
jgi:hypothetical protein